MTTMYIKMSHLQCAFRSSLMIIIFSAVCIQTVIEIHRVFSVAFISMNLY